MLRGSCKDRETLPENCFYSFPQSCCILNQMVISAVHLTLVVSKGLFENWDNLPDWEKELKRPLSSMSRIEPQAQFLHSVFDTSNFRNSWQCPTIHDESLSTCRKRWLGSRSFWSLRSRFQFSFCNLLIHNSHSQNPPGSEERVQDSFVFQRPLSFHQTIKKPFNTWSFLFSPCQTQCCAMMNKQSVSKNRSLKIL